MKNLLLLAALSFFSFVKGQTIVFEYGYDNHGNRISRNVVPLRTASGGSTTAAANPALVEEQEGIEEVLDSSESATLGVYPNPTSSTIALDFSDEEKAIKELRILDQRGRLHLQQKDLQGDQELDFSNLASGTYFIWLRFQKEGIRRFTVIKE